MARNGLNFDDLESGVDPQADDRPVRPVIGPPTDARPSALLVDPPGPGLGGGPVPVSRLVGSSRRRIVGEDPVDEHYA